MNRENLNEQGNHSEEPYDNELGIFYKDGRRVRVLREPAEIGDYMIYGIYTSSEKPSEKRGRKK